MTYVPSEDQLDRYAGLLVGFALGGGAGIAPGEVVSVWSEESGRPLFAAVCRAIWRAGGHVIPHYTPDAGGGVNVMRDFYELASEAQLDFFPGRYMRGLVDDTDHTLRILADNDPRALNDADPARVMRHRSSRRQLREWMDVKESAGQLTWTVGLYGTEAMAAEAGMSLEDYWGEIVAACFLEDPDPAARWREVNAAIAAHCAALDALPIERLHIVGEDVDLHIAVGERRRWLGGSGRNIPSFEVFTSPDWRGTEGWIRFSEPLYAYGSLITGIELEFAGGRVVSSRAEQNEALLTEMLATENADRLGEFSLTDARLSPIRRFMAHTLYDENTGGPYGNTHVALGFSFQTAYAGDPSSVSDEEWDRLGYNDSAVHTDIVSTTDRTVTATMRDGSEQVIYADGRFVLGE